jgi:hypothetical protein
VHRNWLLHLVLGAAVLASCGDGGQPGFAPGPVADLSERLEGGAGVFLGASEPIVAPEGWEDTEYVASGIASDYEVVGEFGDDGLWTFQPRNEAPYRTRVLVRRPVDPGRCSGVVLVEWLNVSGGVDANPDYSTLREEILRQGHIYVAVSAQRIGVEGGPVLVGVPGSQGPAGQGLKRIDPERYGSLSLPGDGFSFSIFGQVGRAMWRGGAPLGGCRPEMVLAVGESQSAIALTTFYNGVQARDPVFSGFFVHSRGNTTLPLVEPGESADLAGSIGRALRPVFRGGLRAPVFDLQAEGDITGILGSSGVRQADGPTFALWEVAGTAHADRRLIGPLADVLDCGAPVNDGPLHVVAKAGLRHLVSWVRDGESPPPAPRIELAPGPAPTIRRDADGIAVGGLRTPPVEVPAEVLSGEPGSNPDIICLLLGSTVPLPEERIAELYTDRADYLDRYGAAVQDAIDRGYILEEDRRAIEAYARPERVASVVGSGER